VRIASALLINMGTLSSDWVASKKLAAKEVSSGSSQAAPLPLATHLSPLVLPLGLLSAGLHGYKVKSQSQSQQSEESGTSTDCATALRRSDDLSRTA
jgi:hypothetical protein